MRGPRFTDAELEKAAKKLCEIRGMFPYERVGMPDGNWYQRWELEIPTLKAYFPQRHSYQQLEKAIVSVEMLRNIPNNQPKETKQ